MENNAVYAPDNGAVQAGPIRKVDREHAGEDRMLVEVGGVDSGLRYRSVEETPLLGDDGDGGRRSSATSSLSAYDDFSALPWYKRPSIYWMLPMFFLTAIANAGILVPKMNLIITLLCREYFSDKALQDPDFTFLPVVFGGENPECRSAEVSSYVAEFTLMGNLLGGILCAITSPKLGALSDRYGRLRIIIITSIGMLIGEVIVLCAASYPDTISVGWILVAYGVEGLFGSFIAAMAIANSYATDCIPIDRRNVVFGYFHAALFTGIALGPILSAYIIEALGSIVSIFYIAAGVHVVFILFAGLVIPESLTKDRQLAAREKHALERAARAPSADWINRIRHLNLLEPLKILYPTGEGSSPAVRRNLLMLAGVDTTVFGVHMGAMTVVIIYTNYQFGWTTVETSRLVSLVSGSRVFCLLVLLPIITRLYKGSRRRSNTRSNTATPAKPNQPTTTTPTPLGAEPFDLALIRLAIALDTLGYLGYALATSGAPFMAAGALAAAGGMGSPTLQSSLTKHVPADRTGQLLGAMGLLHALARVVAPTAFNAIYAATVGRFTQLVFVCLAGVFGVAFVAAWFVRPGVGLEEKSAEEVAAGVGVGRRDSVVGGGGGGGEDGDAV
ncbi:tetracycline-efflux transporter protein [Diplodia corticola]|uniref:Tetracycline-efflux transporter protein n=1 Tax=Diplodia corticola TaxID=236234 RepID=A0A1J9RPP9_9PEZI|nr:tetracycline-efflux transporter protein [Diplodia corticola]OJD34539.1 tetracycline-efflux transporter protein [Diplodia corticola]